MSSRSNLNLSVPPPLKKWIERRAKSGGFEDSGEFVRHLLREAWQEDELDPDLEAALLDGLNSGPATPMTKADWAEIRSEGRRRVAATKAAKLARRRSA
ncbi:MAG: type II toxin-antitoxin system ParD family antitoxin [Phycisphaerales bacterium]|nr:type II toxin-antitoxin system ParD family antitoxin [Phycisphaerales bacterium]